MSESIKQELGFDCSKAIAELARLDKAMQNAEATTRNFAGALGRFNGSNASRELDRLSQSQDKVARASRQMSDQWTTSAKLLSRVVFTQAIVRALSSVRNEFNNAAEGAANFQKKVAEIQTIGGGANTADLVRGFSDISGFSLADVGAAQYQALSNQIGEAAHNTEFLTAASHLARGGVASLEASVSVLSGTLNAYGKTSNEAGDLAGKFFKTVELGRTTVPELANDLSRVAAIAAQLGISLDELLGAYAGITITGTKSSMAITQLSGTMNAFLKPTKEMEKALRQLNFQHSKSAIQTLGFQGALQAVVETTDGSEEAIAKLIPRTLGLSGAMIVTGRGAKVVAKNIKAIKGATADLAKSKAAEIMATNALQVEKAWGEVSNAIKIEFGGALLSTNKQLFDLIGGSENVIEVGRRVVPVIMAGGAALGVFAAKALYAKMATGGLLSGLRTLPGAIIAVGAAVSAGQWIGDKLSESSKALQDLERSNKKALDAFKSSEAQRLKASSDVDADRVKATRLANLDVMKGYQQTVAGVKVSNDQLVANTGRAMAQLVKAREKAVRELGRAASQTESAIQASQDRVADLTLSGADRKFERQTSGFSDARKVLAMTTRAQSLASQAAKAMVNATDPQSIGRAVKLFDKAVQLGDSAEDLAGDNRSLAMRAAKVVDSITSKQIRAEGVLQKSQKSLGDSLRERGEMETRILETLRAQTEVIKSNISLYNEQGELFSADALTERQVKLAEAVKGVPIGFDVAASVNTLRTDLDAAFQNFKLSISFDVSNLEKLLGEKFTTPEAIFGGLNKASTQADTLRRGDSDTKAAEQTINRLRKEIGQLDSDMDSTWSKVSRGIGGQFGALDPMTDKVAKLRTDLDAVSQSGQITDKTLFGIRDRIKEILDYSQGGLWDNVGLSNDVAALSSALGKLKAIQEQQKIIALSTAAPDTSLPRLDAFLMTLGQAELRAMGIASQFERAANAAQRMSNAAANPIANPIGRASGGIAYLATGGRGTDTIPAMLTKGEYVINAKSSRRFYSQLSAMNAGSQPVYRESGGTVTNIGDVNVTVAGGDTAERTVRRIGNGLRREFRRGSLKF